MRGFLLSTMKFSEKSQFSAIFGANIHVGTYVKRAKNAQKTYKKHKNVLRFSKIIKIIIFYHNITAKIIFLLCVFGTF